MSGLRKRVALQLTPLLDLLLIVLFAQYMDIQQRSLVIDQELEEKRSALTELQTRTEAEIAKQRSDFETELNEQKASVEQQRQEYAQRFQSILDQHEQAAKVMADALQLPGQLMEQIVRLRAEGSPEDAQRLQAATSQTAEMLKSRGDQLMQFIIRFDEMQKHVSVWEVHLQENGQAVFTDGDQSQTISFESEEGFLTRLFEASKSFGDPRTLVLVILTYGDAQAGARRKATDAMPKLIEQLRKDSGNTRWYDFSLLGYRPKGGLFTRPVAKENTSAPASRSGSDSTEPQDPNTQNLNPEPEINERSPDLGNEQPQIQPRP